MPTVTLHSKDETPGKPVVFIAGRKEVPGKKSGRFRRKVCPILSVIEAYGLQVQFKKPHRSDVFMISFKGKALSEGRDPFCCVFLCSLCRFLSRPRGNHAGTGGRC